MLCSCQAYDRLAVWYKYRNDYRLPKTLIAPEPTLQSAMAAPMVIHPSNLFADKDALQASTSNVMPLLAHPVRQKQQDIANIPSTSDRFQANVTLDFKRTKNSAARLKPMRPNDFAGFSDDEVVAYLATCDFVSMLGYIAIMLLFPTGSLFILGLICTVGALVGIIGMCLDYTRDDEPSVFSGIMGFVFGLPAILASIALVLAFASLTN